MLTSKNRCIKNQMSPEKNIKERIGYHVLQKLAVEPLKEHLIFSNDRQDINLVNQAGMEGLFGLFQCKRIQLWAMTEAKTC